MQIPIDGTTAEQMKFILERLATLNDDYTQMSVDVAVLKNDVALLMKVFWIILSTSIVSAMGTMAVVIRFALQLKNKKNNS